MTFYKRVMNLKWLVSTVGSAATFFSGLTGVAVAAAGAGGISTFTGFGFTRRFFASLFRMLAHSSTSLWLNKLCEAH